ncbi:MAG: polysaccharide deacetylase family protein [Oscillospiraceae bacterium]|nr:polysaccharide deacetylase family protein [Oscillospiraceae bacterium]
MGIVRKMLVLSGCLLLMGLHTVCAEGGKCIAITFDDGPSGHYTADLLEGLEERGVRATFFLCGYRVDQFPALTKRIAREGHEIGTHSDAHKFFSEMTPRELCRDLKTSVEKIEAATGKKPTLLRPPGGIYDRDILSRTECADLPIILWSVDPDDWCCCSSDTITKRVLNHVKEGDIILLHDMSESSVKAALQIIDRLQSQGYIFVTVSELARLSGKSLEGGKVYYHF